MFVHFLILILLTKKAITFMDIPSFPDKRQPMDKLTARAGDLDTCGDIRDYYEGYLFEVSVQTLEDFRGGYEVTTTSNDIYNHFQLTTGDERVRPGGRVWADVLDVDYFEETCYLKTRWFFPVRDKEELHWARKYRCNLALLYGTLHMTEPHNYDKGFCIHTTDWKPVIQAGDEAYQFINCKHCNRESFTIYMTPRKGQTWYRNFRADVLSAWKTPMENVLVREPRPDGRIELLKKPAAAMLIDDKRKLTSIKGFDFELKWKPHYKQMVI